MRDNHSNSYLVDKQPPNLHFFFDVAIELLCIADFQGNFIKINKEWERVLGYTLQELTENKFFDFIHPEDLPATLVALDALGNQQPIVNFVNRYKTKSGEYLYIEWKSQPIDGYIYAAARDITERMNREIELAKTQETLLEQKKSFLALINSAPDCIFIKNSEGRYMLANMSMQALYGASSEEIIGKTDADFSPTKDEVASFHIADLEVINEGKTVSIEEQVTDSNGILRWFQTKKIPIVFEGQMCVLGVARDISEAKLVEEELRNSIQRFEDVAEAAGEYIWELDINGLYQYASKRLTEILKRPMNEIVGHGPFDFMPVEDAVEVEELFMDIAADRASFKDLEHRSIQSDGNMIWQRASGLPIYNSDGDLIGYRGTGADITDRKLLEQELDHMANYDTLTALPNRRLFFELLKKTVSEAERDQHQVALMFIDLDGFKAVNDTHGHDIGDELLIAVGQRISNCIRDSDTVARLGGDEFTIILRNVQNQQAVAQVAQKILDTLHHPFLFKTIQCNIGASIGIGLYPDDGVDAGILLNHADKAMYDVKHSSKGNYRFYNKLGA